MTNIYLDIDGVLLDGDQRADGSDEFIACVTTHFPETTYWLSGRCDGDAEATVAQLETYFDKPTIRRLRLIKATVWSRSKIEAIDLASPFLWFDDVLDLSDEAALARRGLLSGFVLVDLHDEHDQLHQLTRLFPSMVDSVHR